MSLPLGRTAALGATILAAFALYSTGAHAGPVKDPAPTGPVITLVPESGPAEGSAVPMHGNFDFDTSFEFKSVETDEFECSVDYGVYEPCRSGFEVHGGPAGPRSFSVRGIAPDGARGPAETRHWYVVLTATPTVPPFPCPPRCD
jgi:hypothetical protein